MKVCIRKNCTNMRHSHRYICIEHQREYARERSRIKRQEPHKCALKECSIQTLTKSPYCQEHQIIKNRCYNEKALNRGSKKWIVYKIEVKTNEDVFVYIGSTGTSLLTRLTSRVYQARKVSRNEIDNFIVQNKLTGKQLQHGFTEILAHSSSESEILELERRYIDKYQSSTNFKCSNQNTPTHRRGEL